MGAEPATVGDLLRRNRAEHGTKAALVTPEGSVTHAELDDETAALATRFAAAGVGKSARVGVMLPNGIDWAVIAMAVARIGAVLVPLSTLLRPRELEAQLDVAGVTHLVLAREHRGRAYPGDLEEVAPGIVATTVAGGRDPRVPALRAIWLADELPVPMVDGDLAADLAAALEAAVRPADDLTVLFTSGSSGAPKGVVHTHGSALRATAAGLEARCVHADERLYIPMPFFWTGGLAGGLLTTLVAGATLVTEAVPEPEQTLALLERERVTLFRGWPDQAARLAADPRFASADLSSLRPGSLPAVLPADRRPAPGVRANLFGMTETFGPYCGARHDLPPAAQGSCGRPFDGVEVRIVDVETGDEVAPGETGEIRVRGRNIMRALAGRTRDETFDRDGFYPTRDLGVLDADGFLWFHGRLDDMFKVKGATVYPAEVEAALRDVAGVHQAHVTNVANDDGSEAVGALVVSDRPLEEVTDAARSRLSSFKVPTRWIVTATADDVPLTPTAKIDKRRLQELLAQEGSGR